jgi:hypothetical protein
MDQDIIATMGLTSNIVVPVSSEQQATVFGTNSEAVKTKLDSALALVDLGYEIHPNCPNEKFPAKKWRGMPPITDHETVRRTWAENPDFNIGIPTTKIAVKDFDPRNNPNANDECDREYELLCDVGIKPGLVKSQGGGRHMIFRQRPNMPVSDKKLGPGLELKGVGGQIAAVGSTVDGRSYKWIGEPVRFEDLPLLPMEYVRKAHAPKEQAKGKVLGPVDTDSAIARAIDFLKHGAKPAVEGEWGDRQTWQVACDLRKMGISHELCGELMWEHYNPRCAPPWEWDGQHGMAKKIDSAYNPKYDIGENTPEAEGFVKVDLDEPKPEKPKDWLRISSVADALRESLETDSAVLIRDLLDLGCVSVVYGPSNAGKTFVVSEIARCVARGHKFAHLAVPQAGRVLYVALEGTRGFKKRVAAMVKEGALPENDPNFKLVTGKFDLFGKSGVAELRRIIADVATLQSPVKLVIIDTLAAASGEGDENATKDMNKMVGNGADLAEDLGPHVLIVHHSGKDLSKGGRGSVSLKCRADTEIEVIAGTMDDPSKPARIHITKQRDREFIPDIPFRLKKVHVGTTPDLEEVNSAIVEFLPRTVLRVMKVSELPEARRLAALALHDASEASGSASTKEWQAAHKKIFVGERWSRDILNGARAQLIEHGHAEKFGERYRLTASVEIDQPIGGG